MRMKLGRNDSVTNFMLFVYNRFMVLTGQDAIKLSDLLEIMKVFEKNESAVRMSLLRSVKNGCLVQLKQASEIYYRLSPPAREFVEDWRLGSRLYWHRYTMRHDEWNQKWYTVHLRISEKQQKHIILERFQKLGLGQIYTHTWVSPYLLAKEVRQLAEEFGYLGQLLEMYGDFIVHKPMDAFMEEIYSLGQIAADYRHFVAVYERKYEETLAMIHKGGYVESGHALRMYYELSWNFFRIAALDPVMPAALYEKWEGDRAVRLLQTFRADLLPCVNQYFDRI